MSDDLNKFYEEVKAKVLTLEYLEYYREIRKELAEEDYLEIEENDDYDPKIGLRHFNYLSEEEDDDETEKIVHQRMLDILENHLSLKN